MIKSKLSKNEANIPAMNAHLAEALDQHWGNNKTWRLLDWQKDTTTLISQAAAAVFVGPQLVKNPEWQELTVNYVLDYFTAIGQIRQWPAVLWPVAHHFNSLSQSCRRYMKRARTMMRDELDRREAEKATSNSTYNDAIKWLSDAAGKHDVDHGALQLALVVAALFTTSEALRQTFLEICKHPNIISPLRDEIEDAISQHGWSTSALFKMRLLDSVMKEAQRTLPAIVDLERKALSDTTLPNGVTIPRGSHLAVDASLMWSPDVHTNPKAFDGHRYLSLREKTGSPVYAFTASSKEHATFGLGRSVCPGRFLADTELKLCLAQILLKYDFRLQEGYKSSSMYMGFYPIVDPVAKVEVRRRE
ncbi:unnamed protein product [Aureobasidium uvarum]|uniref:Cytochrome P450 n=1 Tax=Aureobasidium uvarum TaxID=2773716 RepID=A0A9N8KV19_9PEZI|nr:unnamed protein product [Aureobasidium uvarum]